MANPVVRRWLVLCFASSNILVFLNLCDAGASDRSESPCVGAPVGKICGERRQVADGKSVYSFTGIPYARPPTGKLRYRKPEIMPSWGDTFLDATNIPPACMQVTVTWPRDIIWVPYGEPKSEDCLYLNVWTPALNSSRGLPVMAWLHGGYFQTGGAAMSLYDGGNLAALGGVIVVTIAYRLQSFGFFYDGTYDAPGNQGLHDQILALTWIRDNIGAFGGNSNRVTLFGWSAGALATGFHLIANSTRSLFHRAIIQSGSATITGRARPKSSVLDHSSHLANIFGCRCPGSAGQASCSLSNCLRNINATLLSVVEQEFVKSGRGSFGPMFGDELLPVNPNSTEFTGDKDVIIGQVGNEGSGVLYINFRDTFSNVLQARKINKVEMINYITRIYDVLSLPDILRLQEVYMRDFGDDDYDGLRQALTEMVSNTEVVCGSIYMANKLHDSTTAAQLGKAVYFYEMDYIPRCSTSPLWFGPKHGDDLPLLFGRPFDRTSSCSRDIPFSRSIIKTWSNFAKGRTPTGFDGSKWPAFTPESSSFLRFTARGSSVSKFNLSSRCRELKALGLY